MDPATLIGVLARVRRRRRRQHARGRQPDEPDHPARRCCWSSAPRSLSAWPARTMADAKLVDARPGQGLHQPRSRARAELVPELVTLADKARREGLLALEDYVADLEDPFLVKALTMAIDGTDPEELRDILEAEIQRQEVRGQAGREVLELGRRLRPDHRHRRHRHGPDPRARAALRAREARSPDRRRVRRHPVGRPVGQRRSSCPSAPGSPGSVSSRSPRWSS